MPTIYQKLYFPGIASQLEITVLLFDFESAYSWISSSITTIRVNVDEQIRNKPVVAKFGNVPK